MKRLLVAFLIVLASARPARADDVADEAQFHFVRGNQFYREGHFDEALSAYYASNRLVPNRNVQFNIARAIGPALGGLLMVAWGAAVLSTK